MPEDWITWLLMMRMSPRQDGCQKDIKQVNQRVSLHFVDNGRFMCPP